MLFRTFRLKTLLQAGTMLLAAAYTVLLIYHNKGVTQQTSRSVDVRWQERGPRSIFGDYDSNSVDLYNDSMLVKGEASRESEASTRVFGTSVEFGTVTSMQLMNTTLDDIFISVKTTRSYHKWRLPVILKTWFQLAKNQTWFFTDSDDSEFQQKTNGHMINTNCSSSHNRKALCCKMSVEFDVFLDSNKKWFCHFDDDNYVNVPRLVRMLRSYNSQKDWYLGKPSIRAPLEIITKDNAAQKISFWFATGGAGFCLSRALALKMMPVASGGKFISVGEKIRLPDDVTMGYIIEHLLRKHLTVVEQFHSHLEPMKFLRRDSLHDQEASAECRMNEQIVQDWLAEFSALSPVEVSSFASGLKHNIDLIRALYGVLENYTKFYSLIDPISKQLFNFYRSREVELKLFTLQFLPSLIYIYLNSVAQRDKKSYSSVETLLIGIYNLEVVDEAGQPSVISFRLPSLAQASIYHEPMSLAHASLTETALRRLEECNTKLVSWGPHPQVETLNAQNRLKIIAELFFIYNRHIGSLNKMSLKYLCCISSLLAVQGFKKSDAKTLPHNFFEGLKFAKLQRIPVSSQLFLELLCGLYYAMYNDFGYEAMQGVNDIYNRSCMECYSNVIIVANAIRNSSHITSKGKQNEGPMGISVALSPATNTVTTVNKFMITNASFRTKKLPDDLELEIQSNIPSGRSSDNESFDSETQSQKSFRKGKWKGWHWLHNSTNRHIPEVNEDSNSPKNNLMPSSVQTSPIFSKKSRLRRFSADVQTRHRDVEFNTNIPPFGSDSPKRKSLNFVSSSPNRVSAGARLYKVFEEDALSTSDEENLDENLRSKSLMSSRLDDIPIITKDESNAEIEVGKSLSAITEEKEDAGFSGRGSSFRGKDAMTKNLQKLGIGKKLKDKESKSSSRMNFAGTVSSDRKQSTSLQLSTLIEKVSLKSPALQNGDFSQAEGNGHGSLVLSKKKNLENDPFNEVFKDGVHQEVSNKPGSGFVSENQSVLTSYNLDNSSSNDDTVNLYNSNKTLEDKPLMQVSSV